MDMDERIYIHGKSDVDRSAVKASSDQRRHAGLLTDCVLTLVRDVRVVTSCDDHV